MSDLKLIQSYCVVLGCNVSSANKPPYVNLHPFPTPPEMRSKWLMALKNRCTMIDCTRSRICSNHFESKYFDSKRQLICNAIPTRFSKLVQNVQKLKQVDKPSPAKYKLDKLLNNLTLPALQEDVRSSMQQLKMPDNLGYLVNDNLKCPQNTATEFHHCLLLKKQEHLINRLYQENIQNKQQIEMLLKNMEEYKTQRKELEQNLEHYKYIAKCLQEKHATLEEQIEILTALETR